MFRDRAIETVQAGFTGTGTYNLGGAGTNAQALDLAFGSGATLFYMVRTATWSKWEAGWGVVTSGSPDTLTRNVLRSWNGTVFGTSAVSWVSGDHPLYVYSVPLGDALASMLKSNAATSRPPWLPQFGMWLDTDTPSGTVITWNFWDGADSIPIGTFDLTNNAFIPSYRFGTTQRLLGRNTAGAGAGEEVSLTQLLDWVGGAAQGDFLYRGASSWARLPAGTATHILTTNGAGANATWQSILAALDTLGATQGQIFYRSATQWTVLSAGTSGQFLKTLGAGANPAWATVDTPILHGGNVDTGSLAGSLQVSGLAAKGARHLMFFGKISVNTNGVTLAVKLLKADGTTLATVNTATVSDTGGGAGCNIFGFATQVLDGGFKSIHVISFSNGGAGGGWAQGTDGSVVDQVQVVPSAGTIAGNLQVYYTI